MQTTDLLMEYIENSPSPYHAVHSAAVLLEEAGFTRLEECAPWTLEGGRGYYTTRNQSSLIAFRLPEGAPEGWRLAAAHSDSPTFHVKNDALEGDSRYIRLSVEGYGGMNMATWLDRPLSAAGRVLVRGADGELQPRLVNLDRDLLVIPSLAPHMDRAVNDGHKYNPQLDMQPLYGPEGCRPLGALVAEALGVAEEAVVDWDLTLYVRQAPTVIGPEGEYFLAPRIDDLECAAATLYAFLEAAPRADSGCAPVWAMLDNEEVGSGTRQGAHSLFLRDTLDRVLGAVAHSSQGMQRALANSFVLSADNAHAQHPNFADKADPANPVRMGGGVVLKVNASQKYTTNGLSGALLREICRQAGVPVQLFANRADLPGGSTLGNLLSQSLPVPMADIGLAQLAMHSAVETAATADARAMVQAAAAFYRARLRCLGDGRYTLESPQ